MNENTEKRLACNCCFGQEYPSIPWGKVIIGCTEDNIWCNDFIAAECEMFKHKNDTEEA